MKHAINETNKEKISPKGTNVGLDLVSIDMLDWITEDTRANKHDSKKGTQDLVCKDINKQAKT